MTGLVTKKRTRLALSLLRSWTAGDVTMHVAGPDERKAKIAEAGRTGVL